MSDVLVVQYPKCSTCRNAVKYLKQKNQAIEERHIVEQPPTTSELKDWISKSGLDIRKFFNTSGQKYRELGLKDRLPTMTEDEMVDLLSSDGMLIKRPIIVKGDQVTVGFKPEAVDHIL